MMIRSAFLQKFGILSAVILFCLMSICPAFSEDSVVHIVSIWDAPKLSSDSPVLDFDSGPSSVQMQRRGFERALREYPADFSIMEHLVSEQSSVVSITTELAELYNNNDIVLTVGASSDLLTMYTSMETEFFQIPFLVPFADGTLNTEYGSGYTFRISPDTDTYARYIQEKLITSDTIGNINSILFENRLLPEYQITTAVFFENNYNGNNIAVSITQNLMDDGLDIEFYEPFVSGSFMKVFKDCQLENPGRMADIDLVIIIGEDKHEFHDVDDIIKVWADRENPPTILLLGHFSGGSASEFVYAENVFVIRQALDMSSCPADIISQEEALGYAAGYLVGAVLDDSLKNVGEESSGIRTFFLSSSRKQQEHQDYLMSFRTSVLSGLRGYSMVIPCYGKLGMLQGNGIQVPLELVQYTSSTTQVVINEDEIFNRLRIRVAEKTGTPYQ